MTPTPPGGEMQWPRTAWDHAVHPEPVCICMALVEGNQDPQELLLEPGGITWHPPPTPVMGMWPPLWQGDAHQLLDHLGMSAMQEQPVHLCAQSARKSAPDSVLHQDARQFFFLEKKWDRDKSSGGGEKMEKQHTFIRERAFWFDMVSSFKNKTLG